MLTGHDDGTDLRPEILAILEKSPSTRSEEETALLWQECRNRAEDLAASRIDLANLRERLDVLTQSFPTMVMDVAEKPRETYVLHRGVYLQPTDRVEAGDTERSASSTGRRAAGSTRSRPLVGCQRSSPNIPSRRQPLLEAPFRARSVATSAISARRENGPPIGTARLAGCRIRRA